MYKHYLRTVVLIALIGQLGGIACSPEGAQANSGKETLTYLSQAMRGEDGALSLHLFDFGYAVEGTFENIPVEETVCVTTVDLTHQEGNFNIQCVEPGGRMVIPVSEEGDAPIVEVITAQVGDNENYICGIKYNGGMGGSAFGFDGSEGPLWDNYCQEGMLPPELGDGHAGQISTTEFLALAGYYRLPRI